MYSSTDARLIAIQKLNHAVSPVFFCALFWLVQFQNVFADQAESDVPTVAEIRAAYLQNFSLLLPIAVTYELEQIEGEGLIEAERLEVLRQQTLLEQASIDGKVDVNKISLPAGVEADIMSIKRRLEAMIKEAPKRLEGLKFRLKPENIEKRLNEPRQRRFYLWSDRDSFHVRWPKHQPGFEVQLEQGVVTPEFLEKNYSIVQMISRSKRNDPPVRFWYGTENNPRGPAGEIGSGSLNSIESSISYPPIGFVIPEWAHATAWNDIDRFMSFAPAAYQLVGKGDLNGKPMIILDCFPEHHLKQKPTLPRRIRGWIDPNQGFLPVRLEYAILSPNGEERLREAVSEITEIQAIDGSYYPMHGIRQEYVEDARWEMERLKENLEKGLPGSELANQINPNVLPGWRRTWHVSKVVPHFSIDPAVLDLKFPIGTVYLNRDSKQWSRTGTPQRIFNLEISKNKAERMGMTKSGNSKREAFATENRRLSFWIIVNVVLLIALGAASAYFKRKGRKS